MLSIYIMKHRKLGCDNIHICSQVSFPMARFIRVHLRSSAANMGLCFWRCAGGKVYLAADERRWTRI